MATAANMGNGGSASYPGGTANGPSGGRGNGGNRVRRPEPLVAGSRQALNQVIEGEIIPRLLVAHDRLRAIDPAAPHNPIDPIDVEKFAPLPLKLEADELLDHVEQFQARGFSVEAIFVDLLANSARKLGEMWEADHCDFVDVTIGLWRLQEVMREIALRTPGIVSAFNARRRAIFSPMPDEQHSFGALMIHETFTRNGWDAEVLVGPDKHELLGAVSGSWFDLIGLTVSCDYNRDLVAGLVTAVRSVSANPAVKVLVGGPVVNLYPALAEQCGANGTAPDALAALGIADKLVVAIDPIASFSE